MAPRVFFGSSATFSRRPGGRASCARSMFAGVGVERLAGGDRRAALVVLHARATSTSAGARRALGVARRDEEAERAVVAAGGTRRRRAARRPPSPPRRGRAAGRRAASRPARWTPRAPRRRARVGERLLEVVAASCCLRALDLGLGDRASASPRCVAISASRAVSSDRWSVAARRRSSMSPARASAKADAEDLRRLLRLDQRLVQAARSACRRGCCASTRPRRSPGAAPAGTW